MTFVTHYKKLINFPMFIRYVAKFHSSIINKVMNENSVKFRLMISFFFYWTSFFIVIEFRKYLYWIWSIILSTPIFRNIRIIVKINILKLILCIKQNYLCIYWSISRSINCFKINNTYQVLNFNTNHFYCI